MKKVKAGASNPKPVLEKGKTLVEVSASVRKAAESGFTAYTSKPTREKINNTELLAETGVSIYHVHPDNPLGIAGKIYGNNGMTVAFKRHYRVLEIATAVCSRGDTFNKKEGTRTAVKHFQEGKTILVPLGKDRAIDVVIGLFG
jgi:hypothetical protein